MQADIKSYERTITRKNQYDKESKDPIERVKGRIEAICLDNDIHTYDYIEKMIDAFDNKIEQNKKQYINPTAFIFGEYVITNKNIDKKKLNEIFIKYSDILRDNSVEKVDIIRYARFWLFSILDEIKTQKPIPEDEEEYIYDDEE